MVLCIVRIIFRASSANAISGGNCASNCGNSTSNLSRSFTSSSILSLSASTSSIVSNMDLNDQHIGIS